MGLFFDYELTEEDDKRFKSHLNKHKELYLRWKNKTSGIAPSLSSDEQLILKRISNPILSFEQLEKLINKLDVNK